MKSQVFDYETEAEKIGKIENFKLEYEQKKQFKEKTKFSLEEIFEYLEYALSSYKQQEWLIIQVLFYDEKTNKVDLKYYAIEKYFEYVIKRFIRKGTNSEQYINMQIDFLERNKMMFLLGTKSTTVKKREDIFSFKDLANQEQRNYLEEEFFNFPQEYDFLYNIIVDHINRKNNLGYSYTKKV